MKTILLTAFLLILPFNSLRGGQKDEFIYFHDTRNSDLFTTFDAVLNFLLYFDNGFCKGIEVDFQKTGFYYDRGRGPNWWTYFFEPVSKGNPDDGLPIPCSIAHLSEIRSKVDNFSKREQYHKIIRKYIRIQPTIRKKTQDFFVQNCKDFTVIGMHYYHIPSKNKRRIPYDHMSQEVRDYVKDNKLSNYRIFVSTNEQAFIDYMRLFFPNRILFFTGHRTPQPHHNNPKLNFQAAERELMECLLLSKFKVLIHTPTHLGIWASRYNPELPLILVDGRKAQPYRSN